MPAIALIKDNTAYLNGGLFHSVVAGAVTGTIGCEILI
jgi:hypothetical protein